MKKKALDRYLQKFDELNTLVPTIIEVGKNKFQELLVDAYIEGFMAARYILGGEYEIDNQAVKSAISKEYDGVSIFVKADEYIENKDTTSLQRLLESEWHRVYNQAELDYAVGLQKTIKKKWVAVMDDKTRDTHWFLDGTTIPLDAYFYSYDGDKALAPGGFSKPENNVNCRCVLDFDTF